MFPHNAHVVASWLLQPCLCCWQLVEVLAHAGVPLAFIGLVSPYRAQLKVLQQLLDHHRPELEVYTVDRYQGRDKECVLVSFVRSNDSQHVTLLCAPIKGG